MARHVFSGALATSLSCAGFYLVSLGLEDVAVDGGEAPMAKTSMLRTIHR